MGRFLRIALILAVILMLVSTTVGMAENTGGKPPVYATLKVEATSTPITYTVAGSVISDGRIELSSRVVGFIQQLDVREGQKVARGDLLVRIDPTDIDQAIRQARAGVQASEEDLQDAEHEVEMYGTLVGTNSVSKETFRKAKVRRDIARVTLDKALSALAGAEAQKNYASITSPVDGVVVSVARRTGEMATTGATLLTVESREVLLFKAYVSESNLSAIDPEKPVSVRIDTLKDAAFRGRIRGIVPSGDDVTRRYEINVVLPADPRLVPGMFGRADIVFGMRQALMVPRAAIVTRGGLQGAFVLDGTVARFRWLRTGRTIEDRVEVVAGLSDGERIVSAANDTLWDGSEIRVAETAR